MNTLNRYIFKLSSATFLGALLSLTLVVWITQVLREVDLVTSKGQTIVFFFQIAAYLLPMLMQVIAPIALFTGVAQCLNKLSNDSELIVMTASGLKPRQLMAPFLVLTTLVTIFVIILTLWLAPASIRQLRILGNKAQSNIISTIVKPGRFIELQSGLTFHIKDRAASGLLQGLLIVDNRDPLQQLSYIAESGYINETDDGSFLVLDKGTLQKRNNSNAEVVIVGFDKYAFDLTQFSSVEAAVFRPSERSLSELISPPNDALFKSYPGRFRQELHDRFTTPLYPLAFMMIALAYLGQAQTTRQSRTSAIFTSVGAVVLVKGLGLVASSAVANSAANIPLVYLAPIGAIAFYGGAAMGAYNIASAETIIAFASQFKQKKWIS